MDILEIVLALSVFISSLLLSVSSLSLGFLLFLVLTPLQHKEIFSLIIWDLLTVRLVFLGVCFVTFSKFIVWFRQQGTKSALNQIKLFIIYDPAFILLLGLFLVRAVSLYKSESIDDSLKLFAFFASSVYMYVVMKVLWLKYSFSILKRFVNVYLYVAAGTVIFTAIQYYFRACCRKTIGAVWVVPGHPSRYGSTFWDVNHYGGFLAIIIPITFSLIFASKKLINKVLFALFTGVLAFVLYQTSSRSSWIGLTVAMFVSLILYYVQKLKAPIYAFVLACVIGIFGIFAYASYAQISLNEKIAAYMHYRLDSTDTHFMLLEGAAEVLHNNIFLGGGYGNFDAEFRKTETADEYFEREPKLEESKVPAHSVWGEVIAETGFLGATFYSLMIIIIFMQLLIAIFDEKSAYEKYLMTGLFGSTLAILTTGIFYSYNMEFFWIILFITGAYGYLKTKEKYPIQDIFKWWMSLRIAPYFMLLPIAAFFIYIKLGATTLIDWDEAIYAKVAKNMLLTGDWLSLRWHDLGEYWFEKPPFYMWITAGFFNLIGFNSFAARMSSAIFGLSGIILTYIFASRLYNKLAGVMSALVLVSTIHYLYYSRNGMLDVTVTFFIISAVYAFYMSRCNKQKSLDGRSMLFASVLGLSLGFAVMTKAVIGLLPVLPLSVFYVYSAFKKQSNFPISNIVIAVASFLLVAAPWHIYQYTVHGNEFINQYFYKHILGRAMDGLGHEQPFFWYLSVIKTSFRIWLAPFVLGLFALPFIDKGKRQEYFLLTASVISIFLFFSSSRDKLQWYIIPIYPFLAIIAGRFMERSLWLFNNIIKKEFIINTVILRFTGGLGVLILALFSIVSNSDKVYYPDFNKDRVALLEIFNDSYPMDQYPDKVLYYNSSNPPVLYFYTDHPVKSVTKNDILSKIEDADPQESVVFLTRESLYYDISKEQSEIDAPLVLDVKGSANDWILFRSKSRVEVLEIELKDTKFNLQNAVNARKVRTLSYTEIVNVRMLQARYIEILGALEAYGAGQQPDPLLLIKF